MSHHLLRDIKMLMLFYQTYGPTLRYAGTRAASYKSVPWRDVTGAARKTVAGRSPRNGARVPATCARCGEPCNAVSALRKRVYEIQSLLILPFNDSYDINHAHFIIVKKGHQYFMLWTKEENDSYKKYSQSRVECPVKILIYVT